MPASRTIVGHWAYSTSLRGRLSSNVRFQKMPSLYLPPYDSPIEDAFAHSITKYLADAVSLKVQVPAPTICGRFVIDFVLSSPEIGHIGVECDGHEFHDARRDEWRDAVILGGNLVDSMYRLRGSDITYHLDDILYFMGKLEPGLMSERGMLNLRSLSSDEARAHAYTRESDMHHIRYSAPTEGALKLGVRRTAVPPGQRRFWRDAYRFAESIGGGDLESVMRQYTEI